MYLKRIEMSGFKSFATKTILDFLPSCSVMETKFPLGNLVSKHAKRCGITAIVGPNGSGKSNVADAMKWAMGEQSLKNLRGKKSEDVIFAGSGKKSQLGSAKVSLFFDNSDKSMPLEFEEVVISRKIYRSGEGEYFINGSKTRLIDISDLLAKAGVGQRSYCIIDQGMADSVLNATPVERRITLEEAAGVKPYQLKKERSLRKLDSTKNNLERIADLVKEIEPHLKVLRRQSEKAQKGEAVALSLKKKQKNLYGFLWKKLQSEKEKVLAEKEEIGREEMKLQRNIDDLEIRVKKESKTNSDFEERRSGLEKEKDRIFESLNQERRKTAMIEARIEIEKEKARNLEIINEIPVDLPYIREEIKKIQSEYQRIEQAVEKISDLSGLDRLKGDFRNLRLEIGKLWQEVSEGKKSQETKERKNIVDLKAIGELEFQKKEIEEKLRIFNGQIEENRRKMGDLLKKDREARELYFQLEAQLREKQHEITKIRENLNEVKVNLARVEVREEDLRKKIQEELRLSNPDEISSSEGLNPDEKINPEELEREIYRLKIQAEQIGAIDPMIIEECVETQKRYSFLVSQSEDLEKAIVTLAEVIKEMDERIKVSFEETYKKVNSEFSKYFKIIFGGGSAEMIKIKVEGRRSFRDKSRDSEALGEEEENEDTEKEERAKEIGIEIKACPPGKRISNLGMLSGGERTLTSQALLFAIIANYPPPFAV
ncbi:MAG: AAA family ATPase, partial [Candidatus Moranbacteria bacterium]|nr:AAA family ATPase [Candidatus Moranbacteria bacterium]